MFLDLLHSPCIIIQVCSVCRFEAFGIVEVFLIFLLPLQKSGEIHFNFQAPYLQF